MALPGVNPTYQYLDNNIAADGTYMGQSASCKLGFFGVGTPVVQPSGAAQAAATTTAVSTAGGIYGFTTVAQADSIIGLVNKIRTDLVALGIIKGS